MRKEQADRLKAEEKNLEELTDNLEIQMEMKGRKKYLKQKSLATIEKKLEKKNLELEEVREFRKKLNEKEKEIIAAIEKLENEYEKKSVIITVTETKIDWDLIGQKSTNINEIFEILEV